MAKSLTLYDLMIRLDKSMKSLIGQKMKTKDLHASIYKLANMELRTINSKYNYNLSYDRNCVRGKTPFNKKSIAFLQVRTDLKFDKRMKFKSQGKILSVTFEAVVDSKDVDYLTYPSINYLSTVSNHLLVLQRSITKKCILNLNAQINEWEIGLAKLKEQKKTTFKEYQRIDNHINSIHKNVKSEKIK